MQAAESLRRPDTAPLRASRARLFAALPQLNSTTVALRNRLYATAPMVLPQGRTLVWQDAASQVWLGYNDPDYLAQRHGVPQCGVTDNLRKALAGLADAAVAP